jgi:predicted amidohydrolase YtcJ
MADLVLFNARIYSFESAQSPAAPFGDADRMQTPRASAIALRGERILALGDDAAMRALLAPGGRALDLHGRAVYPGFVDAHIHFDWYSLARQGVDAETPTLEEALARVAARAAQTPPGEWISGQGWNQSVWGSGAFPTAADLDRVAPAHPVMLRAKSGHAAWVNTLALARAGVTAATPDSPGGSLARDAHGAPSGILFEDAVDLVTRRMPARTPEASAAAMHDAFPGAWQAGLTGIHDFDTVRAFVAYQLLRERGELGLRVVKSIPKDHAREAIAAGLRSGFGDHWLRIGNVKVFADGALGPRTAAMFEPFIGEPGNRGIVTTDKEELYELASQASAAGLSMTVHAIGDRANHDVLDVLQAVRAEEAARGVPPEQRRHRIEHVQALHPMDFRRLAELRVIASMQPLHATSDMLLADRYWGARSAGAYALRTQLDAGAILAFGSDCPVEVFHPLRGIHAAVTRRRLDGSPGPDGWYPEQRLSVAEAIRGFTWGAAYAAGLEHELGTLAAGKLADLVVLDEDLFAVDPMHIPDVPVAGTMIGGRFVWSAEGW